MQAACVTRIRVQAAESLALDSVAENHDRTGDESYGR